MVGIVLGSHGRFAEGIMESGQMIFGPQEDVAAVCLTPEMGPADFRARLNEAVASFSEPDNVLFLIDLWGGTPFNQASGLVQSSEGKDYAIVTGMNLPMLIEAYGNRMGMTSAKEIAVAIYPEGRGGVRIQPEELEPQSAEAPAAPAAAAAPAGAIPPGTVLGDGHIKIAHVRVDTRLLHGQVATAWTKAIQPDRIIVVSDSVSQDELRRTMIVQAAPPGVKVHVVPMSKMIEVAHDVRFGNTKAFILFETPQEALEALEGGVDIKKINLGSMAHSVGKVVVSNAIAMGPEDVACLETLQSKGVEFDVRKVPTDSPENFAAMMQKAKTELAAQA